MRMRKLTVLAASLAFAACTGSQGPQGPAGPPGANGSSQGTISGTVTSTDSATNVTAPVPNVSVTLTPVVAVSGSTSSSGSYTLANVPIGTYVVTFSGTGIATTTVSNVTVVAGATVTVNASVAYSPITINLSAATPTGFSSPATVNATVSGETGTLTYSWSLSPPAGLSPTATVPSISSPSGTMATFTTNAFTDYDFQTISNSVGNTPTTCTPPCGGVQLAGTSLIIPNRATLLGISPGIEDYGFNYTVTLKVSDGTYTQTASTSVYPIGSSPGTPYNAAFVTLIANDVTTAFDWTLTYSATDPTVTTGTTNKDSLLQNATGKNPFFTTDGPGFWELANGATGGAKLLFRTDKYVGVGYQPSSYTPSTPPFTGSTAICGSCHGVGSAPLGASDTLSPDVAWGLWTQSAHSNYYWDPTGIWYSPTGSPPSAIPTTQVTINGATGYPTVGTITIPTVAGAFTLFSQGIDGAVFGSVYSQVCIMCHTDGYKNPEALPNLGNGGFSDVAAADGWTFPNNSTINYNRYASTVPANLQNLAGIQCESCHGPIGMHPSQAASTKPLPVWNATACAVCHDEAPEHAESYLWSQSRHANYQVAISEGAATAGGGSGSCPRCHTAQGFAAYVDGGIGTFLPPATIASGTVEGPMPQTCQACHNPHTTTLRVNPANSYTTPAGFVVENVGKGSTCLVCHNTRNFQRGDNVPACATGVTSTTPNASPFCTPVTSIALPSGTVTVLNIATPHDPRQGDVFMGANAYFVTTGIPSKHAVVADACVGCHMQLHPTSVTNFGDATNHTFKADGTICVNCHASTVSGTPSLSQLEGQFTLAQQNLFNAMPAYFTLALGASPDFFVKLTSGFTCTSSTPCIVNLTQIPTAISIVPQGGSFTFTLGTPVTVTNSAGSSTTGVTSLTSISLSNISLTQVNATTLGPPAFMPNGVLARVLWNDTMVSSISTNPAAIVIHNPTFVFNILAASQAALENPPVTNGGACVFGNCTMPY